MNRILSGLVVIATCALAACGAGGPSGSPISTATAAPSGAPSSAAASVAGDGVGAGQTDTEWGRIWDTLPDSFPQIPGARSTDEASADPASARFVVAGDVARLVATALDAQLANSGFPTAGLGAPLEDGSYVLDATGPTPDCKVQVTVSPKGGETFVTILYGAACPHD
jgi:predicted small lipoprotein YifL